MALWEDWKAYQKELENALLAEVKNGRKPPKDVLLLLKTDDLKAALKKADEAKKNDDVDEARTAQAKSQKFFFAYANQYKAAKLAIKGDESFSELNDFLSMFNVYMTRTQTAVARSADTLLQEAKTAADSDEKKLVLNIKSALSPLKFKSDWKAGKTDFERTTKTKKPSDKVLGAFRKSTDLESSLGDMDKACEKADVDAYRKAFSDFQAASSSYASILEKALASDKANDDEVYETKCNGLKELLNSIESRTTRS